MSKNDQASAVNEQKVIGQPRAEPESKQEREQAKALKQYGGAKDSAPTMQVKIYSPFRDYFDGRAYSVTAQNATGEFDILPKHHNFMSLLSACDMVVRAPSGDQHIFISGGLLHVKADSVIVFLDV